jgi:spore germination protein GerM
MQTRRLFRVAVTAIVVAIVGAGCGGSTEKATTTTTTSGSTTTTGAGNITVAVYFTPASGGADCEQTTSVDRAVRGPDVLAATVTELLAGPTANEQKAGLRSWFSADTADSLLSAEIVGGTAHIDFKDFSSKISSASSSCGSSQLLSQLDRTAQQFPAVDRTLYSFDGNVEAFYSWLQRVPPDYYTPAPSTTSS